MTETEIKAVIDQFEMFLLSDIEAPEYLQKKEERLVTEEQIIAFNRLLDAVVFGQLPPELKELIVI